MEIPMGEPEQKREPTSDRDDAGTGSFKLKDLYRPASADVGVKKRLLIVPVGKPGRHDFVRTHPSPDYRTVAALIRFSDERDFYLVSGAVGADLEGEHFLATLHLTINRQGTVSLWPVPLPGADGKHSTWHRSATMAAEQAQTKWVSLRSNMNLRAYDIFEAINKNIPEPEWPEESMEVIVQIAFRDRYVDSLNHPVVKRLWGET
jgi:hypothetical protein